MPFEPEAVIEQLVKLTLDGGSPVSTDHAAVLVDYLLLIMNANRTINLTGITDVDKALRLHLLDSLMGLPEVNRAPLGALLDLGTGGGFPGVPLAVAAERPGVLLDSVAKKTRALREVLAETGLSRSIDAECERAETFAQRRGGTFGVVTARAVAPLGSLVELASPLLQAGGLLVALKGLPSLKELEDARATAALVGMEEVSARRFTLPGGDEDRTIVSYARTGVPSVELPRRVGLAQRSPLSGASGSAGPRL